jgi:hypothetical protein
MHCALDTSGIVSPINFPLIWLGRPIAVAHFDVKLGGVIGHYPNMRRIPWNREARSIATTIKLTLPVGLSRQFGSHPGNPG